MMLLKKVSIATPLPLFYVGPNLEEGPLPCLIYLALSAKETLLTAPFNQPVSHLHTLPIRIFSVDLPFHGENLPAVDAMKHWAESLEKNDSTIPSFLDALEKSLHILFTQTHPTHIAIAGLSRGCFIASHMIARLPQISSFLAFAPLTHLYKLKEFASLPKSPLMDTLDLSNLTSSLCQKKIRMYIGNRDTRVHTDLCFAWARSLVEEAHAQKVRSPHVEFFMKPSIGHQGHGTSPESFKEGSEWISQTLKVSHE